MSITNHSWNPALWETCAFKRGVTVEQLCPCPPHDDGLARPAACCWTRVGHAACLFSVVGLLHLVGQWALWALCLPGTWWALVGLDGPILCEALRSGGNTTFCNWLLDASITLITPCVTVIQIIVARSCLLVVRKMEIPPFVILTSGDFWQRHLFCEFC